MLLAYMMAEQIMIRMDEFDVQLKSNHNEIRTLTSGVA